jgi:hypothetical protein
MTTMAIEADDTAFLLTGGWVFKTEPMMNIMTIIQAAPNKSDLRLPNLSMPTNRKMPVVATLTVP